MESDAKSSKPKTKKREDYLSWDDYFMGVAFLSAQRSKDPSTQVGCCIVDKNKKIIGIGYNGMPLGCNDDELPWARDCESQLDTKYPYICHAEMNAVLNSQAHLEGCTLYTSLYPCNECAKIIIQSRISNIVYFSDKLHDTWPMEASRRLLKMAGIQTRVHQPERQQIVIDFTPPAPQPIPDTQSSLPMGNAQYFRGIAGSPVPVPIKR